jgi:hypothetical protein
MHRFLFISILVILFSHADAQQLKVLEHERFSFQYPASWTDQSANESNTGKVIKLSVYGKPVTMKNPGVTLTIDENDESDESTIEDLLKSDAIRRFSDEKLIKKQGYCTLSGEQAYCFTLIKPWPVGKKQKKLKVIMIMAIKGDYAYLINFYGLEAKVNKLEPEFEKIIASFRFK